MKLVFSLLSAFPIFTPSSNFGHNFIGYQRMLLTKTNRIITTDSKVTMRDNSCIAYSKHGSRRIGIVHKIIHVPEHNTFIIVYPLEPSNNKLCSDTVTNAAIDIHITQLHPPKR